MPKAKPPMQCQCTVLPPADAVVANSIGLYRTLTGSRIMYQALVHANVIHPILTRIPMVLVPSQIERRKFILGSVIGLREEKALFLDAPATYPFDK